MTDRARWEDALDLQAQLWSEVRSRRLLVGTNDGQIMTLREYEVESRRLEDDTDTLAAVRGLGLHLITRTLDEIAHAIECEIAIPFGLAVGFWRNDGCDFPLL